MLRGCAETTLLGGGSDVFDFTTVSIKLLTKFTDDFQSI